MTFAWYAHLRDLRTKPLIVAILVSWDMAFFEYTLQVPANRLGSGALSLAQLKILQEVIALAIFAPFVMLYRRVPLTWDYLWASLGMMGAVYFIFHPYLRYAFPHRVGMHASSRT